MPRHKTRRYPLILARKVYRCILRDALWLTADPAVAASRILLAILVGLFASIPWTVPTMRVGWEFAAFWTASRLALAGCSATRVMAGERQADGRSLRRGKMGLLPGSDKEKRRWTWGEDDLIGLVRLWICGQRKRVAHKPTAATSAEAALYLV